MSLIKEIRRKYPTWVFPTKVSIWLSLVGIIVTIVFSVVQIFSGGSGPNITMVLHYYTYVDGAYKPLQSVELVDEKDSNKGRPVFFDFNILHTRPELAERIKANADFLKKNPDVQLSIEPDALALGEKRALAARKYLIELGVDADRLSIYRGEDKADKQQFELFR